MERSASAVGGGRRREKEERGEKKTNRKGIKINSFPCDSVDRMIYGDHFKRHGVNSCACLCSIDGSSKRERRSLSLASSFSEGGGGRRNAILLAPLYLLQHPQRQHITICLIWLELGPLPDPAATAAATSQTSH